MIVVESNVGETTWDAAIVFYSMDSVLLFYALAFCVVEGG
jgi:hypothetical protein